MDTVMLDDFFNSKEFKMASQAIVQLIRKNNTIILLFCFNLTLKKKKERKTSSQTQQLMNKIIY